jgi:hypothetical protein
MTEAGRLNYEDVALLAREEARNGNRVQFASAVGQLKKIHHYSSEICSMSVLCIILRMVT